jgi:Aldehyde dehydrogenase family
MTAEHVTHWIGGKPWTGTAQRQGDLYDPATGQVAGVVDFATRGDVDDAVAAAKEAAKSWGRWSRGCTGTRSLPTWTQVCSRGPSLRSTAGSMR